MNIPPLNFQIHAAITMLGIVSAGLCLSALNGSLNTWAESRAINNQHSRQIEDLRRDATREREGILQDALTAQHAQNNNYGQYNSVTILGYTCDPSVPPAALDWVALSSPTETLKVLDQHRAIIGEISPQGAFTFYSNCNN